MNELNSLIRGWVNYYRYAQAKGTMQQLDQWVRRKLRCYRLKQCKRAVGIARFLMEGGVTPDQAWMLGGSGKGWWRIFLSPQAHRAMGKEWFKEIKHTGFAAQYMKLELFTLRKPPYAIKGTYGGVRGGAPRLLDCFWPRIICFGCLEDGFSAR